MHNLPLDLVPSEITSRYLRQTNHYTASIGRVKPRAFHPDPNDDKTSIFRVQGLTEDEMWALGTNTLIFRLAEYCWPERSFRSSRLRR